MFNMTQLFLSRDTRKKLETWNRNWLCTIPYQTVAVLTTMNTQLKSTVTFKIWLMISLQVRLMISVKSILLEWLEKYSIAFVVSIARLVRRLKLLRDRSRLTLKHLRPIRKLNRRKRKKKRKSRRSNNKILLLQNMPASRMRKLSPRNSQQISRSVRLSTSNRLS